MKRLLIICLMIICSIYILANTENVPKRAANIPEDAKWERGFWIYGNPLSLDPNIKWRENGSIFVMYYDSEDKKSRVVEYYYANGKLQERYQRINHSSLNEKHKNREKEKNANSYVGKYYEYHENGRLKSDKCYTFVINRSGKLTNEVCGVELAFDENGKEIKRIDHKIECEYGCGEAPKQTEKQIVDKIKKDKNIHLTFKPEVGKIDSISSESKNIDIKYNKDYPLEVGDEIFFLVDDTQIIMSCASNKSGIGQFVLKEDKKGKFSSIKKNMKPYYYKANEIKNEDFINKKIKPKSGEIVKIGGIEFVYIPGGEGLYTESSLLIFAKYKENKVLKRHVDGFWISKCIVTLGEYLKYAYEGERRSGFDNKEKESFVSRYPVVITYGYRATSYCDWFSKKYRVNARLLDTFEWEYAVRGGTITDYYWGNAKVDDYCWYKKNSGGKIHPVGMKKPNAFGLYDIVGNVWEWCDGGNVIVGGSAFSGIEDLSYSAKYHISEYFREQFAKSGEKDPFKDLENQGIGFRIVISDSKK